MSVKCVRKSISDENTVNIAALRVSRKAQEHVKKNRVSVKRPIIAMRSYYCGRYSIRPAYIFELFRICRIYSVDKRVNHPYSEYLGQLLPLLTKRSSSCNTKMQSQR